MSKLTIHPDKDSRSGYISVNGERLEGVEAVIVTESLSTGQVAVQFVAHVGDIEVDWSNWEESQ